MKTFASLFSGGGLADVGALQAGYTPIWAVEYERTIADVYAMNISPHVIVSSVQDVDPTKLDRPDVLHVLEGML